MERRKVLYIAQELVPYLPETPMAQRSRAVAQGMAEKGWEVRTFMPRYGCVNERRNQLHEVIRLSGINLIIDDTDHPLVIKVATLQPTRMQVYFIDNDDYFRHAPDKELETKAVPELNDERSIFFVRGVMETVKRLRWAPELVYCTGWLNALTPLYLKRRHADDPSFRSSRIVFSVTDPADMPGRLDARFIDKLRQDGFTDDDLAPLLAAPSEGVGYEELVRLAVAHADAVVIETDSLPQALRDEIEASGKLALSSTDPQALADGAIQLYDTLTGK